MLKDCQWKLIERINEEEYEGRKIPDCVLKVNEFVTECVEYIWSGSVDKFLTQHSAFT